MVASDVDRKWEVETEVEWRGGRRASPFLASVVPHTEPGVTRITDTGERAGVALPYLIP